MKSFLILCIIALAAADVKHLTDRNLDLFKYDPSDVYTLPEDIDDDKPAVIFNGDVMKAKVEKLENLNGNKKFKLNLKTQNGIEVSSVGKLKDEKTFVVSGSYSFTGADGKRYKTRYTADEFGYHPITELDLDIPEPQPLAPVRNQVANKLNGLDGFGSFGSAGGFSGITGVNGLKNRFQFLNQNLNSEGQQGGPLRGSGQSGDDYSYSPDNQYGNEASASSHGYDYNPPAIEFQSSGPSLPSRQYLPVQ